MDLKNATHGRVLWSWHAGRPWRNALTGPVSTRLASVSLNP